MVGSSARLGVLASAAAQLVERVGYEQQGEDAEQEDGDMGVEPVLSSPAPTGILAAAQSA